MSWDGVRRLILPTALTVTSISVVLGCGSDEGSNNQNQPLVECSDVPAAACQKCLTPDGGVDCAASPDCFYDPGDDACHNAVA
jgi:hypothetical protein